MKKLSLIVIASLSLAILIEGCTKSSSTGNNNNNNNNNGAVSDLVANFTNTNSSTGVTTTYSFTYDAQNRITGETISDGSPTASYSYGTGTVTKIQGTTTTVYTLDNAGHAVSDNQGNTYTYDGNGFLTNESNPSGASTVNTISNSNIATTVQTTSTGTTTNYSFTFMANPNSLKYGLDFLGAPDANLIKSESINGVSYSFSYTFDSHGRVQTLKIVSGPTTLSRTYTYIN